jgi:YHS domain-containing protein
MLKRAAFPVFGALMVALVLIAAGPAPAAKSEVNKSFFGGVAIEGTDPVAYFADKKPIQGSADFAFKWNGAEWRFKSAANRDTFAAAPEKYAPQFGGYCAWAVSRGYPATIDPEAWSIVDGRLYLNYSKGVQAQWSQDVPGNIAKGHANWPGALDK